MSTKPVDPNQPPPATPPMDLPPTDSPPMVPGSPPLTPAPELPLPHERDQSPGSVAGPPDPMIEQAKRDIDAGMVDTDMRATPGLDAQRRAKLVPGPGGQPPKI